MLAHVAAQVKILVDQDAAVRTYESESIHDMRVAARHLRSVLATFRPLFRAEITDPVRTELTFLGRFLGAVRDAEVQSTHLLEVVAAEPPQLVMGSVAEHIGLELQRDSRTAEIELSEVLDSPRYRALLDTLDRLLSDPPLTTRAGEPAVRALPAPVARTWKRIHSLADHRLPEDPDDRDRQLHEIRKSAKDLRYACEAVEPALGRRAARLATTAERWQTVLGDHQDSVVVRATLQSMGERMFLDGRNSFTIGRLHALEQRRGQRAEKQFLTSWSKGSGRHRPTWLDE
ncbi:CHAD domain-containing protein [Nakamurella sp. UYEF19]|uniref:CHAD domain-containing protein n=1 Tax=Nakamurella sp. UYEF19 TaxID=1756392 RepID=UPI00339481CA